MVDSWLLRPVSCRFLFLGVLYMPLHFALECFKLKAQECDRRPLRLELCVKFTNSFSKPLKLFPVGLLPAFQSALQTRLFLNELGPFPGVASFRNLRLVILEGVDLFIVSAVRGKIADLVAQIVAIHLEHIDEILLPPD